MKALYCSLYTFIFMGIGVLTTLIGQYLDHLGFSGQQIGIVTAAGTLTAIIASPVWGRRYSVLADRGVRYVLVALVFACAAGTGLLLSHVSVFAGFLPMYVLLYFFQSPSSSLMDALTIDEGQRFGHIRTFGAIGFAVACFGAASLADAIGIGVIFPIYAGCFLAGMCTVLLIRCKGWTKGKEDREEHAPAEKTGRIRMKTSDMVRQLAMNRPYVLLLACAFFTNGTDVANNTYFSFLFLEGGGTLAGVGIAFLLMAGSEAPFMAASDWLCDRFGQGKILLVAIVFSSVRFGLFSLGLPAPGLIALFPLQGLVNGIRIVEFVKFVARVIPDRLHGIGIAIYYALGSSFSAIVCQLVGGRLLDHGVFAMTGPQSVYLFFALFNVAGVLIFLAARLHRA